MTYDRVYTIDEWYDGACTGAATFRGEPHAYRRVALGADAEDAADERFELTPIRPEVLSWMLERDVLYRRWQKAHDSGRIAETDGHSTRILPPDRARAEQLDAWIHEALSPSRRSLVLHGAFEYGTSFGRARARVRWLPDSAVGAR